MTGKGDAGASVVGRGRILPRPGEVAAGVAAGRLHPLGPRTATAAALAVAVGVAAGAFRIAAVLAIGALNLAAAIGIDLGRRRRDVPAGVAVLAVAFLGVAALGVALLIACLLYTSPSPRDS